MQQDTYYENEELTKEDGIENDNLMFNYIHKKFRTHLENSKILSETNILQNRKSVIFQLKQYVFHENKLLNYSHL